MNSANLGRNTLLLCCHRLAWPLNMKTNQAPMRLLLGYLGRINTSSSAALGHVLGLSLHAFPELPGALSCANRDVFLRNTQCLFTSTGWFGDFTREGPAKQQYGGLLGSTRLTLNSGKLTHRNATISSQLNLFCPTFVPISLIFPALASECPSPPRGYNDPQEFF